MLGSLLGRREFSEGQNLGSYLGGSCTWSPWPWTPATSTFSILHWRQDRCLPLLQPRKSPWLGTKVMMSLLILSVFPRETAITWHFYFTYSVLWNWLLGLWEPERLISRRQANRLVIRARLTWCFRIWIPHALGRLQSMPWLVPCKPEAKFLVWKNLSLGS